MEALTLRPGASIPTYLDAHHRGAGPLIVYDGPIEGETMVSMEDLPEATRLFGRVWTGGPRVVIRYYAAQPPGGPRIPFCAVAADNGPGLPKSPGRPGSAALERTSAWVYVTGQFR